MASRATQILRSKLSGACDLEQQIEAFVEHYNHQRYHESLNNVTPADAYFGRAQSIIQQRERIKRQTIEYRRLQHRKLAA
jgi:putative transposase